MDERRWKVPFFTMWTGQAFSLVGSALVRFALIWWLTEETGSAVVLSTASIVAMLPFIVIGPFVGTLVDRWSRRWVMIVSDTSTALFTALLAYLYWIGRAQIWHVYAILFVRSLGDTFQGPAMRATTSLMVPRSELTRVGGMNETLMGVVNIVSPPLGALLLDVLSMQGTLAIDIVTAVLAIVPLFVIHIPQPDGASSLATGGLGADAKSARALHDGKAPFLHDFGQGLRYLWNWRGLLFLLLVLSAMRFFTAPLFSLLPLLVTKYFGGGVLELGWMNSAHGFGFIAGGFILSVWGGFKRQTITALAGLFGLGLGTIGLGLVPSSVFWLALAVMSVRSVMVPMIRGPVMAIFQTHVPPEMQGRVFTLLISVVSLMAPVGLAIAGPLAERFGVQVIFVLGGLGCLAVAVAWLCMPTVLYLEDRSAVQAEKDQRLVVDVSL